MSQAKRYHSPKPQPKSNQVFKAPRSRFKNSRKWDKHLQGFAVRWEALRKGKGKSGALRTLRMECQKEWRESGGQFFTWNEGTKQMEEVKNEHECAHIAWQDLQAVLMKMRKRSNATASMGEAKVEYYNEEEAAKEEVARREEVATVEIRTMLEAEEKPNARKMGKNTKRLSVENDHLGGTEACLGVSPDVLQKVQAIPLPPPPFEDLPNTGGCTWTWDEAERIIYANFSCSGPADSVFAMNRLDEDFFLRMMERDDVTLISEGLVSAEALNLDYWDPGYIGSVLENDYHHTFRRFDKVTAPGGHEEHLEVDGMVSMKGGDYIRYLETRQDRLNDPSSTGVHFSFVNHQGEAQQLNVEQSTLYMVDLNIKRLLPQLYDNLLESIRYKGVLPGGFHCLMNAVPHTARPIMGPNLYVTPPAAFTQFHQDGHGTVDSGHLCMSGFNEVVMFRRLTEYHKKHVLKILSGSEKDPSRYFDGLYTEPHDDGKKPSWPSAVQIQRCRAMGYCPTVCILKPGQLIHINKGRLHAFRKMSISRLPEHDCHKSLREAMIQERGLIKDSLCVSVAWDWVYRGVTEEGINREMCAVLEAAALATANGKQPLANPEFCLLQTAKGLNPQRRTTCGLKTFVGFGSSRFQTYSFNTLNRQFPDSKTISRGILPSLRHVVKQQLEKMKTCRGSVNPESVDPCQRVTLVKRPHTHENTATSKIDPYAADAFTCKICFGELSNLYYHCDGCENLCNQDFNICLGCHKYELYKLFHQMHPTESKKVASLNHTGDFTKSKILCKKGGGRGSCKHGYTCAFCRYCLGCSCRCHTWFTIHLRMFGEEEGRQLLNAIESAAGCTPAEEEVKKKWKNFLHPDLRQHPVG